MKKNILVLILILGVVAGVFCQNSGPMDLVVLLDTSASMSSHYHQTSDYLIGPFLKEFLRIGDTFHLISFSNTPRLEISRLIENVGDVEAVIGRLLLMYPLDPQSNMAEALSFGEQYASSLPGSRPRKIILVSDGDAPDTQNLISSTSNRLRGRGTELQFIQAPFTGALPSSGRPPAQTASQPVTPPAQPALAVTPPPAAPSAPQAPPASPVATSSSPAAPPAPPAQSSPAPAPGPSAPVTQAPASPPAPATPPPAAPPPSQPVQTPRSEPSSSLFASGIPLPLLIGLILLALIILGLLFFLIARRLHSSPNRVMARAAAPQDNGAQLMGSFAEEQKKNARPPLEYPEKELKPLPKDKVYNENEFIISDGDPVMLNLFVEDQNTAIGRRNIHVVKPGYNFSVGGGKSDFLIFLVPIPPHIADVVYDGRNCTLIPRKPEYFPDIGSQSVSSCIGKTVRVMSDKKYELQIRVERYQDPLKVLNKMLHSISVPGEVK